MGSMMQKPTVLDLFSGCGGMSWGLEKAGFQIIAGLDHWLPALKSFQHNHPGAKAIHADVATLSPHRLMGDLELERGQLDCLIGGPPCQGFSKNVPASARFLEDPRNQLFRDFLWHVEVFLPKVVFIENVAEIYNAFSGQVREEIVASLEQLGYTVEVTVVLAADYGVPQRRRRCFFFASRTGVAPMFPMPTHASKPERNLFTEVYAYNSAWSAISELPILLNGEGYEPMAYDQQPQNSYQEWVRHDSSDLFNHLTRKLNRMQLSRLESIGPGQGLNELPLELRPKSGYSGAYGRLDFEMVAPTITRWVFHPGSGRFAHPREARLLTIREAARIQSFTDDFRFLGTYIEQAHQVGNAVPPLLMYRFANAIANCLGVPQLTELTPSPAFV